jgi:hypothetical protein
VHSSVDTEVSVLIHLFLPVNSHLLHFSIRLEVNDSCDAIILQLLDLVGSKWVWSEVDVQVAYLRDDEISVEEPVHLVDHSVNEENFTGVNELMSISLSKLTIVSL